MSQPLFEETYCSESIADLGRDVSECFDSRFNPKAAPLTQESVIHVTFTFTHEDEVIVMHNRQYSLEEVNDIEENLYDAAGDLDRPDMPGFEGFFEGDMKLVMTYENEE